MPKYVRTTRECAVGQVKPEILRSMREYFRKHDLGPLESECLSCCETVSEQVSGSGLPAWLDTNAQRFSTVIVLTERSLIWCRLVDGDAQIPVVIGAQLVNIVARGRTGIFSKEFGLEVTGLIEESRSNIHGVIALGPEPAAQKFCDDVQAAIQKINPPNERKWPAWMMGGKQEK